MMSWMKRLSIMSSLGTDAVMIYEALSEKDAETASMSFVAFIVHLGHLIGVKELSDERMEKYKASLTPIVADLMSEAA